MSDNMDAIPTPEEVRAEEERYELEEREDAIDRAKKERRRLCEGGREISKQCAFCGGTKEVQAMGHGHDRYTYAPCPECQAAEIDRLREEAEVWERAARYWWSRHTGKHEQDYDDAACVEAAEQAPAEESVGAEIIRGLRALRDYFRDGGTIESMVKEGKIKENP